MNSELSSYLKDCRKSKKLSLNTVFKETGITDSRLHRIENNGEIKGLTPEELSKLTKIYDISMVDLLIKAKYLSVSDLKKYQTVFKGVSILDDEEREHIQHEINFINRKKAPI